MKLKTYLLAILACLVFTSLTIVENKPKEKEEESKNMNRRVINPVTWQDAYGFVQGNEITGAQRVLYTAGQVAVDKDGMLLYPGHMEKQMEQVLYNLEQVLVQSGFQFSDVVKFTYYTTNIPAFTKAAQTVMAEKWQETGCRPATTLIGVNSLFHPECVVEIEAIAMK